LLLEHLLEGQLAAHDWLIIIRCLALWLLLLLFRDRRVFKLLLDTLLPSVFLCFLVSLVRVGVFAPSLFFWEEVFLPAELDCVLGDDAR